MLTHSRVELHSVTCVSLLPDNNLKVKDVLMEFNASGRLARHRHGEVRGQSVLLFAVQSSPPNGIHGDAS